MGFLDALIGGHTNAATSQAAAQGADWLWQTTRTADDTLRNARDASAGFLNQGATNATGAVNRGYGGAQSALTNYGQQGQSILGGRTDQAVNTALGGNAAFQPYASAGGGALSMLTNAYGLNGQAGNDAAAAAFKASPGYDFQVSQAVDAASRAAAAQGMAGSGNVLDAITRLGSNLANQEYGNWRTGLQNQATQGLAAATGISTNDKTASGYQSTAGTTGALLSNSTGSGLASSMQGQGTALGNIANSLGINLANNETGTAQQVSANDLGTQRQLYNGSLGVAERQDQADSANNGILSQLLMGTPSANSSGLLGTLKSAFKL